MSLDELENRKEYQVGLWYSPFVKVYSIGGRNRVAEISNYPRAYKDTSPHLYIEDTPFTVTKDDFNHVEGKEEVYRDSKEDIYRLGEAATHWKNDPLPGAFPLWIEDDNLSFTPDDKEHTFSLDKVPAPIVALAEAGLKVGASYVKLLPGSLNDMKSQLLSGKIVFPRKVQDGDKQVIRIRYRREF